MIEADNARFMRDHEFRRAENHEAAVWTAIAVNNPKKMPRYKPHGAKRTEVDEEWALDRARGYFMALSQRE